MSSELAIPAATETPRALFLSPALLSELARLADRAGLLNVRQRDDARTIVLLATTARPQPTVAIDLDAAGKVLNKVLLAIPDADDDGYYGEPAAPVDGMLDALADGARPAKTCRCSPPLVGLGDDCARCGHVIAAR